mgnify:FL=1
MQPIRPLRADPVTGGAAGQILTQNDSGAPLFGWSPSNLKVSVSSGRNTACIYGPTHRSMDLSDLVEDQH